MTTHKPPSDCVGHCVGTASETPLPALPRRVRRIGSLSYGADALNEPHTTTSETTTSTASAGVLNHMAGAR